MPPTHGHKQSASLSQNHKAQLANAYNELGKELSSSKVRVVGNYTLGKVIGEGAYGKVRIGTHRLTSTRVAIKQIPKAMSASLTREIHHHRQLHHPHITQMYEVIATESHIWIVTELCCGGELFDYLVEKGRLSEDETRVIFGQLCLAVAYLHDNNVVHRDLKLENVLLDERCRVKLGDFGFTREFDRGILMDTFCGTTGYASPEMLQGKRYEGPEVDVWSLGIILYCLLTGTLPFDDDDEDVMRSKIIQGDFEDPNWLSIESRDLIKSILTKDVTKRISIPQILAHPWFTARTLTYELESPLSAVPPMPLTRPPSPRRDSESSTAPDSSEASTQESLSPLIKQPDLGSSTPTTPDESVHDPFESSDNNTSTKIHRHPSDMTIRKQSTSDLESLSSRLAMSGERQPATVPEEREEERKMYSASPLPWTGPGSKPPPSAHRTPARTKRRSVSSIMSDAGGAASPTLEKTPTPLPIPAARDLDFASLLSARTPVIFSTPPERQLLNTLALLGFDTAQIVHSVLTNACDSAGSLWWLLRKKEETSTRVKNADGTLVVSPTDADTASLLEGVGDPEPLSGEESSSQQLRPSNGKKHKDKDKKSKSKSRTRKASAGVQTEDSAQLVHMPLAVPVLHGHTPPLFALVPPTPTMASTRSPTVATPPRIGSPTRSPLLSPSSSTVADGSVTSSSAAARSHPSTPSGSMKDKDMGSGSNTGSKGRKARSGSVSIMQRATTALEAAGLVRKKSAEAFREEKERKEEREREKERERELKEREREKSREGERERRGGSGEEPSRLSHGSGTSSKLTKSPPLKASKDHPPSTPPPSELSRDVAAQQMGSPWVLADSRESIGQGQLPAAALSATSVSHANGPGMRGEILHSHSTPNFSAPDGMGAPPAAAAAKSNSGTNRNKANLLTAFRLWFNEDRKGKRKDSADSNASGHNPGESAGQSSAGAGTRAVGGSRRGNASNSNNKFGSRGGHRTKRPSMSSRRSSSINSRRSSGTPSVQMVVLDSPAQAQIPGAQQAVARRSFGSHTPNSERGEHSSRPSSIRSVSMQTRERHRKSPSQSSAGSVHYPRASTSSPMPMQKYHRRGGSGGSTTRVVRQITPVSGGGAQPRPVHVRSNSTTSSMHSPPSSRPNSYYEPSESEGGVPTATMTTPVKSSSGRSRRSEDRRPVSSGNGGMTFVAQKRQGPFASPAYGGSGGSMSASRSSWKKSWGVEPPGWSSRTAHLPVEVLSISPNDPVSIRDVFSGKQAATVLASAMGDESDWVDEDDDVPAFAGGLGQMGTSISMSSSSGSSMGYHGQMMEPITLSPAPRGHRASKRVAGNRGVGSSASATGGSGSSSSSGVVGSTSSGSVGGRARTKGGNTGSSPAERPSPLPIPEAGYEPADSRTGRRQLPAGRSGPAFKHAIQEEDEEE